MKLNIFLILLAATLFIMAQHPAPAEKTYLIRQSSAAAIQQDILSVKDYIDRSMQMRSWWEI